jgi:hypothetical protein
MVPWLVVLLVLCIVLSSPTMHSHAVDWISRPNRRPLIRIHGWSSGRLRNGQNTMVRWARAATVYRAH